MIISELDSVPGGMGLVGAMGETYCELGYDQVGEFDGIIRGFARKRIDDFDERWRRSAALF